MSDWFENRGARANFEQYVKPTLVDKRCRYLEIGSWTGNSVIWTLENILTHKRSSAVIVDPWLAVRDRDQSGRNRDQAGVEAAYAITMERLQPFSRKCTVYRQTSTVWLRNNDYPGHSFDFIYVDGDHTDLVVMDDAVLCWALLRVGGFMIFDDYRCRARDKHHVRAAVNAFMGCYGNEYAVEIFSNYQYGIRKVKDVTMLAFTQEGVKRKPGLCLKPEVFA